MSLIPQKGERAVLVTAAFEVVSLISKFEYPNSKQI